MIKRVFRGFAKLHGTEVPQNSVVTLTAKTIWKDNNPKAGMLTKSTFIPFIKSLRIEDYEHTANLFLIIFDRVRFSSGLKQRTDRGGNLYYWGAIYRPNGNDGAKIMTNTELVNLVQQYINGKVYIDFDLDELIDEGLNQQ